MSVRLNNLTKVYDRQIAVNQLSFSVQKGEIVGFLGPNGAGKSTTMKMITGYLQPTSGEVFIQDQLMNLHASHLKAKIGYLPESNPLYTDMYVTAYLKMMGRLSGIQAGEINNKVEEIIEQVGLSPERHKKIEQLSKGYRQRVGLAQALIHDPEILILDEPTTGLDPNQLVEIRALIKQFAENKIIILSTHIMQEVEALCNRVLIINKGQLAADKTMHELKESNQSLESIFQNLTQ